MTQISVLTHRTFESAVTFAGLEMPAKVLESYVEIVENNGVMLEEYTYKLILSKTDANARVVMTGRFLILVSRGDDEAECEEIQQRVIELIAQAHDCPDLIHQIYMNEIAFEDGEFGD